VNYKRLIKTYVIVGVALLLSTIAYLIYQNKMYGYSLDLKRFKNYTWIFKESFLKDIDTTGGSWVGYQNTLTSFAYKTDIKNFTADAIIDVWEFENHNEIDIRNIDIDKCYTDDNIPPDEQIILYSGSALETITKRKVQFRSKLKIKLDLLDTIMHKYNSLDYQVVYGDFNSINLYNQNGLQIKLKNEFESKRTLFIVYKKKKSIYFIVIRSEHTIDKEMINNLNLN